MGEGDNSESSLPLYILVFHSVSGDLRSEIAQLSWLQVEDTRAFFVSFLKNFVPSSSSEDLSKHAIHFTRGDAIWYGSQMHISIDVIKQFLMQRISSFRARFLSQVILAPDVPFNIPTAKYTEFFAWVSDARAAEEYLLAYALVGAH